MTAEEKRSILCPDIEHMFYIRAAYIKKEGAVTISFRLEKKPPKVGGKKMRQLQVRTKNQTATQQSGCGLERSRDKMSER